jgi:PAS domain S-box-containing protein
MTRILVVDDDVEIQSVLTTLLMDAGYEVGIASNGVEALAEIEERRPDAVLLDLTMAVMDGWGFLDRIRDDASFRGVPVGVLSSARDALKAKQNAAVWAVVSKPFAADHLLATVEGLVRLSTPRHNAIFWVAPDGVVINWNPGAEWMNGYATQEIVGRSFACLYLAADQTTGKPQRALRLAADEGCSQEEGWRVRQDGSQFLANVVITASYDDRGAASGFGVVTRDITAGRALEDDRNRLLEETIVVNQELEAFSYSVSHDLRAPLRAIEGFSQALLEDHADQLDAGGQTYLHRVQAAGQRMEQLIDDMLRLSRVNDDAPVLAKVDLSSVAGAVARLLDETAPERHVEWTIEPGMLATGDPDLLRIVLDNLLGNAFKFTSTTAAARIRCFTERTATSTVFFIADNGVGFDMNKADRLFGPFQRLHSSAEFEGSGIGLATVQRIIHRHHGAIHAESAVGAGATFRFTLGESQPAAPDPAH